LTQSQSLKPIPANKVDKESWSRPWPLLARLALVGNRLLPRGKGAFPRWIGKTFGAHWKLIVTTQSGCRIAVDPGNLDLYATISNEADWEPWIRQACVRTLRSSDVMFDVGANAGCISNEVAMAHPGVVIKAFEPQPNLASLVALSAALNDRQNIEVFQVAVGQAAGVINLHVPAHALHASIKPSGNKRDRVIECPMISLDEAVFVHHLPAPNLIKIDVEGAELGVLKGAERILKQYRPVVIFEANDNCERFGYERADLFREIAAAGQYQFFKVAPGDTLACPKERAAEFAEHYSLIENG
jgi:FkbM family methyltransferase